MTYKKPKIFRKPIDVYREEKNERDAIYNAEKVKAVRVRRQNDELVLAKARDELVLKKLIEKQAAYLLVALRQKILSMPQTYARRILGITEAKQASKILKEIAVSVLNEIKDFPLKVTDPHWLDKLEDEEEKDDRKTNRV